MESIEVNWGEFVSDTDKMFKDLLQRSGFPNSEIDILMKLEYNGKYRIAGILKTAGYYVTPKLLK
jgi:hypothetical protein